MFLRICILHWSYQICWHKLVNSIFLLPFQSLLYLYLQPFPTFNFGYICLLLCFGWASSDVYFINLVKEPLLVLSFLLIYLWFLILLISVPNVIIIFLLYSLGYILLCFYSLLKMNSPLTNFKFFTVVKPNKYLWLTITDVMFL